MFIIGSHAAISAYTQIRFNFSRRTGLREDSSHGHGLHSTERVFFCLSLRVACLPSANTSPFDISRVFLSHGFCVASIFRLARETIYHNLSLELYDF